MPGPRVVAGDSTTRNPCWSPSQLISMQYHFSSVQDFLTDIFGLSVPTFQSRAEDCLEVNDMIKVLIKRKNMFKINQFKIYIF